MKYRKGYKYQLAEDEVLQTRIRITEGINTQFILLDVTGKLTILSGYSWDGPSGPTIDTPSSMRGSLIHDALYQLIRQGHLPKSIRNEADEIIYQCIIADGMWKWRAWLWRRELKKFAGFAADPKNIKKINEAP